MTVKFSANELLMPANLLSLSRVPIAIVMVLFYHNKTLFVALLALAAVTDLLDGHVARSTKPTVSGALLDPLCDKLFFAILLISLTIISGIQIWQLLLLLMRDIIIALFTLFLLFHPGRHHLKEKAKARWFGKITTAAQFIAILWLIAALPYFQFAVYAVAAVSLIAIIDYVFAVKKWISSSSQTF